MEDYAEPVVHEIKVRRADLLSDLRRADKGAAYVALASQCWYVLKREYTLPSNTKTMCSWKGQASYLTLFVDGDANPDAVWFYPEPKEAAAQIKDRVAFWRGVQVTE